MTGVQTCALPIFGLPAFLIPVFLILTALRLMRAYSVNLWKWFLGTALVMIWASVTFAKFLTPLMGNQVFNPGGNHGLFCVQQMENMIGPPGLTAILLIVALGFLTYLSAETIEVVRKAINPVKYITDKVKFTVTNHTSKNDTEVFGDSDNIEIIDQPDDQDDDEPTVVDLTDMNQGSQPAQQNAPIKPVIADVQPDVTNPDNLTVDAIKQEDRASGKVLTEKERLKIGRASCRERV